MTKPKSVLSHSNLGPCGELDLIISTKSPLEIVAFNGTVWPLINAEFTSFPNTV